MDQPAAAPTRAGRPVVRVEPASVMVAAAQGSNGRRAATGNEEPSVDENEGDYLAGLITAAVEKHKRTAVIEVVRPKEGSEPDEEGRIEEVVLFRFGVRMLDDREDDAAREKHTSVKTDAAGRQLDETDWVRYRCQVIFDATVDDPYQEEIDGRRVRVAGKELWRNTDTWRAIGDRIGRRIQDPVELIYRILLPEEKARFFTFIGNLSRVARGREVRRALNA